MWEKGGGVPEAAFKGEKKDLEKGQSLTSGDGTNNYLRKMAKQRRGK